MKKQELIHLHGLLAEVYSHFDERKDEGLEIEGYEDNVVRPTSLHKGKTEHKEALFSLAYGLAGTDGGKFRERKEEREKDKSIEGVPARLEEDYREFRNYVNPHIVGFSEEWNAWGFPKHVLEGKFEDETLEDFQEQGLIAYDDATPLVYLLESGREGVERKVKAGT